MFKRFSTTKLDAQKESLERAKISHKEAQRELEATIARLQKQSKEAQKSLLTQDAITKVAHDYFNQDVYLYRKKMEQIQQDPHLAFVLFSHNNKITFGSLRVFSRIKGVALPSTFERFCPPVSQTA